MNFAGKFSSKRGHNSKEKFRKYPYEEARISKRRPRLGIGFCDRSIRKLTITFSSLLISLREVLFNLVFQAQVFHRRKPGF